VHLNIGEFNHACRVFWRWGAGRLIRRETNGTDSRAVQVLVTDTGREAYDRLWWQMVQAYEAMSHGISDEEKRGFTHTWQTMLRNTRKHDF
jgi:DNA-binding MarR family transcriptional regulator